MKVTPESRMKVNPLWRRFLKPPVNATDRSKPGILVGFLLCFIWSRCSFLYFVLPFLLKCKLLPLLVKSDLIFLE